MEHAIEHQKSIRRHQMLLYLKALSNRDLANVANVVRILDAMTFEIDAFEEEVVPEVESLCMDYGISFDEASAFKALLDCWDLLCAVTGPSFGDVARDKRLHAFVCLSKYALSTFEKN